jgi:hypothetical protein
MFCVGESKAPKRKKRRIILSSDDDEPQANTASTSTTASTSSSAPSSTSSSTSSTTRRHSACLNRMVQKLPVNKLLEVINSSGGHPKCAQIALAVYLKGIKCNGMTEIEVSHRYGKDSDFGRLYASYPSFQSMPGALRRILSHELYHDIDIDNCAPTFLLQLAQKSGFPCPTLQRYVDNRDATLRVLMSEMSLSREQVKKAFLITQHNGLYTQATEQQTSRLLDAYHAEIMGLGTHLWDRPEHKELKDKIVADSTKTNKAGTFLAWLYQTLEADVIQAAANFFKQQGYEIGALVFDGFMAMEKRESRPVTRELLDSAAAHAYEETGYQIRLSEKSLEPLPEDIVRVLGAASSSDTITRKKLFLFDKSVLLSSDGRFHAGISSVKMLKDAGYAVGVWTPDTLDSRERLTNECGLCFDVVLTSGDLHDGMKRVDKIFDGNQRVVMVDETADRVPEEDGHMLRLFKPSSGGDRPARRFKKFVRRLLREDSSQKDDETDEHPPESYFSSVEVVGYDDMIDREPPASGKALFPIKFNHGDTAFKLVGINAAMFMGKSTTLKRYIDHNNSKLKRILLITNRIQMGRTALGELKQFGFEYYRSDEGTIRHDLCSYDRLIIQYESLRRLVDDGQCVPFDFIVCDEARGIMGQVCAPTNGKHLGANANVLTTLLRHCKKNLWMDADLEADGMLRRVRSVLVETRRVQDFQVHARPDAAKNRRCQ